MAKSIRSKSKRRFRAIKRDNLFGKVETERVERLAVKQAKLKEAEYVKEAKEEQENTMDVQNTGLAKAAKESKLANSNTDNDDAMMQDTSKQPENKKAKRAHLTKKQVQRRNKKWKKFFI
ncbi:hypothetical protein BDF22DRAFT_739510 [Syncephalis plumigaleata]|nr:hypothetical protein BDF22DRAFT_739510 [Syncephalis plumigaleata]